MNVLGLVSALVVGLVACAFSFVLGIGIAAHHYRGEVFDDTPTKKSRFHKT